MNSVQSSVTSYQLEGKRPLPEGWSWKTLRDVLSTIKSGGRPKGGARGITEGVPSLGGEHLLYNGGFDFQEIKYVPNDYYAKMTRGKIKRHDVLVVKDGATTGKTSFVGDDFPFDNAAVNEHVFILRPAESLLPKCLFYWFQSPFGQDCVSDNFRGAAQGGITLGILDNSRFPLAPLDEQERIVTRLEELMSDLEAGVAALERVRAGAKRYKASVLKAACEGKLFGNQGLGNGELPEGWRWVKMDEIADTIGGVTKGRNLTGKATVALPYLRVANVQRGRLDLDVMKEIEILASEVEKYRLQDGDVVLTEGGDWDKLGRSAIWRNQIPDCIHQNHIFRARVKSSDVSSEWLMFYTNSEQGQNYFKEAAKQTTNLASINLTQLRACPIPLPPLEEQRRIVAEVERRLESARAVEVAVEAGLKRAGRLRQAVLRSAFEGRLV